MTEGIDLDDTPRTMTVGEERPIQICTGNRVQRDTGKHTRPHGHNYHVQVTVAGGLTDGGIVADLGVIQEVVEEWDHRFLLERGDPLIEAFEQSGDGDAVVVLEHPPTVEVISAVLEQKLERELPANVDQVDVTVCESGTLGASSSEG